MTTIYEILLAKDPEIETKIRAKWKRWSPPKTSDRPLNFNMRWLFPEGEYEHEKAIAKEIVRVPNSSKYQEAV
uniref:Uncharacterized protein n=1 Tax=viral metagenome TaxID=1070528 RepID=A0A6M3LTY1_9ZZZZ